MFKSENFQTQVQEQVTLACATILAALLYSLLEKDRDRLVLILGLVCCGVTILFFISPLANIVCLCPLKKIHSTSNDDHY